MAARISFSMATKLAPLSLVEMKSDKGCLPTTAVLALPSHWSSSASAAAIGLALPANRGKKAVGSETFQPT